MKTLTIKETAEALAVKHGPNWEKWRRMPIARLWKCVVLSLNINPDDELFESPDGRRPNRLLQTKTHKHHREFTDRFDVARANLDPHGPLQRIGPLADSWDPCSVSLREFAAWMQEIGWEAPAELLAMADEEATHIDTAETGSVEQRKHNKRDTEARNRKWQEGINALAQAHPSCSHASLCRMLANKTDAIAPTIRRNTRLGRS